MTQIYHQDNFATNVTSNQIAGVTTTPLNSIPSASAPFYLALDATNVNGKYEVVQVTSKTATNVNHAATSYAHTTAEEVRMVLPATEIDDYAAIVENFGSGEANTSFVRQALINGNFDVWQRGTAFTSASTPANSDDTYLCDRWNLISDGNDAVDLSQEATEVPEGSTYSMKWDVETAKRFGIVQFLEFKDAKKLKGKTVSLSFKVKSANIAAIRAAVLSWAGTADTLTSDIVSSWAATPTWAASWTAENTPADLTVTSDWTTVKIEGIVLDSATINNLAIAIWLPNEETIGDIIYISQVQLNVGSVALPFQPKSYEEELRACQRYYEKSYDQAVSPGTNTSVGGLTNRTQSTDSYHFAGYITYKIAKRIAIAPTIYSLTGASGKIRNITASGDVSVTTGVYSQNGSTGTSVYVDNTSIGAGVAIGFQWTADAEL